MAKTNIGLVKWAKKALDEEWGYMWGSWGQILTEDYAQKICNQYTSNLTHKWYWEKYMGKRVSDCYGLTKGYLWDNKGTDKITPGTDVNTAGLFGKAKIKGTLASMPDIPGLQLWMPGHVAIYIGNGKFIECAGDKGCILGKIDMVEHKITKGSRFTHWIQNPWIEYITEEKAVAPVAPVAVPATVPATEKPIHKLTMFAKIPVVEVVQKKVNLKIVSGDKTFTTEIDTEIKNETNFLSNRPLAEFLGFTSVEWDDETKTIVWTE